MATRKFGPLLLSILVLSIAGPSALRAQSTITGRVTQGSTLRPLAAAQVSVPGTGVGGLTNNEGRFLLLNVPAGARTVRVEIIGYATRESAVSVAAGQTLSLDFELETMALGLDEIVVTGTAGGEQRRAIGNVVGAVSAEATLEKSAPASMAQMLAGRVAGVSINVGGGNVGSAGSIVIRGTHSLSLGGSPLVYVNGVRYNGAGNRLQDINPEDIEHVEIVKGPAAATLYGTEASNGVIQIITKKGNGSRATVEATVRQGANWFQNPDGRLPLNYATVKGEIINQDLYADEIAAGRPMFREGAIQEYSVSVRGGRDNLTYFVSGSYGDEEGYMLSNGLTKTSLRTNLQLSAASNLDVSTDVSVIRTNQLVQPDGTSGTTGVFSMLLWGNPLTKDTPARGFMVGPPEVNYEIDQRQLADRATASITVTHRPTRWLTQRVVTGVDFTNEQSSTFYPRLPEGSLAFYGSNSTGAKTISGKRTLNQTADYNLTAQATLPKGVTSATSFGAQYFTRSETNSSANGTQMPTSAVSTVTAAAVKTGSESFSENKTFGVFVQETLGWRSEAFLTMAVRADANSAFGESFKAAYYPKVSGTWVASDASFWNVPFVESLKLRGAWGKSGQQPSANSKFKTYTPITGPGDLPAVTPGSVGNPDLKPEVGSELEIGLDAGFFGHRMVIELTHFRQHMTDVILSTRVAPSSGFASAQDVNAGIVNNTGYEFTLAVKPIVTRSVELDLSATGAWSQNTIESLAGQRVQADTRGRWQHIEGYPLGGSWSKQVASAEWGPNKNLINVKCYGGPEGTTGGNLPMEDKGKYANVPCASAPFFFYGRPDPGFTCSFSNNLTLASSLTVSALWMAVFDSRRFNTTEWYRDETQRNSLDAQMLALGTLDPIVAAQMLTADVEDKWYERDDFIKLRELSVAYSLPASLVEHLGVARASLMVTGRNLFTRKDPSFRESGLDPETKANRSSPWPGWQQTLAPIPHSIVMTMRVTF